MKTPRGITLLAQSYGADDKAAATLRLDEFSGSMIAELLENGSVEVRGLGAFTVGHDIAKKEISERGTVFFPPRNHVAWTMPASVRDGAAALAVGRMEMESSAAATYSRSLEEYFSVKIKAFVAFELRGFGSFLQREGSYGFHASKALEDLLNSAYGELNSIGMSDTTSTKLPGRKMRNRSFPGKMAWISAAGVVLAGAFLAVMQFSPDTLEQGLRFSGGAGYAPHPDAPVPVRLTDSSASSPPSPVAAPLPKPAAVEQDSLVLQKDRFSIVLATFYTKRVAREQLGLLKAKGIRAYLWEVSSGGSKFYRLATGNYSTHGSAHESLTSMPKPIAKGAYIQKAAKNVVMYGEKSQL